MNNIPRIGDKIINGKLVRKTETDLTNLMPKKTQTDNIAGNNIKEEQVSNDEINDNTDISQESPTEDTEPEQTTKSTQSSEPEVKEYSINTFKANYENRLNAIVIPMLSEYEQERKTRLVGACAASGALGFLAAIDFFFVDADKHGDIFWALVAAATGSWFWIKKSFEKKIKRKVMPILMRAVPDFSWEEKPPVTKDDMNEAKIFPLIPKCSVKSDDCFKGKYRGVNIDVTECEFIYGKKTVFKGAVIKIDMNKNFEGTTVIRPKKEIEFKHIKDLKKAKLEKIELEDIDFNKTYEIYSTDQIESRYLLTTSFIERFKNITMAFNSKVAFCAFNGKHVYIAPYCKKDLFSIGSLIKPVADPNQFMKLFNEFVSVLELVDHFKLDKKLGL